jgi:hypothetical protein
LFAASARSAGDHLECDGPQQGIVKLYRTTGTMPACRTITMGFVEPSTAGSSAPDDVCVNRSVMTPAMIRSPSPISRSS